MISFREQGAAYSCDDWLRPLCWNRRSLFLRVLNLKSPCLALCIDVCAFCHLATLYFSVLLSWCCNMKHNFSKGTTEPRVESVSFLECLNFSQKVVQISIVTKGPPPLPLLRIVYRFDPDEFHLQTVPNGYPNLTRYPVYFPLPDQTRGGRCDMASFKKMNIFSND